MRILIFGAGVIGCLYGALLSEAGCDVCIYARGQRLESLKKHGLLFERKGRIIKARVNIIERLHKDDRYDCVFLCVRENALYPALNELRDNISPTIVTMVNSAQRYEKWEEVCGKGRILPAFPGAGGGFDDEVLKAALAPRIIQPTTFGEIGSRSSERQRALAKLFKKARIPYQTVPDMHAWQVCHLALVVPIADAYYDSAEPENAGCDLALMKKTAARIKQNYALLSKKGMRLSPRKINLLKALPTSLLAIALSLVFKSEFGYKFMYRHSMKAPDEMHRLHDMFYDYLERGPSA